MTGLTAGPSGALSGTVAVPGDKSISHRALILGALAVGETHISGLLEAEDVLATLAAVRAMGVDAVRDGDAWRLFGRGVGGLVEPDGVIDMGNSGTGVRLLAGVAAGHAFITFFTGDASLRSRPMKRIIDPLRRMGADIRSRSDGRLPMAVRGAGDPLPIAYAMPMASAQVKSAVMLAGLHAPGETSVIEPQPSRDHTERMLRHFGVHVDAEDLSDGGRRITVRGQPEIAGRAVAVPGDISSAAYPLTAAAMVPGSRVTVTAVGVNPTRDGLLTTLSEMGAAITVTPVSDGDGEPIADITVAGTVDGRPLRGVTVPPDRVPSMIDEFPILAAAAATAEGETRMTGIGELRVKESDRLQAVADGLSAAGVRVEAGTDWLSVHGTGAPPPGGTRVAVQLDHRIAMAFLVLGCACREPVAVDDERPIATSFPAFAATLRQLGARIEAAS